jgi:hypothetical protein
MQTVTVKNPFVGKEIYGPLADYRDTITFEICYPGFRSDPNAPYAVMQEENFEDPLDVFGVMIWGPTPERAAQRYVDYIREAYEAYYDEHGRVAA